MLRLLMVGFLLSNTASGIAQYTYFNNTYQPPDYENQNGSAMWNLFTVDTILYCIGGAYSEGSFGHYVVRVDSETGLTIDDTFSPYYDFVTLYTWNDTYAMDEDGNIEGVLPISNNDLSLPSLYRFRIDESGAVISENFNNDILTDSTAGYPIIVKLNNLESLVIAGVYDVHTYQGDIDEGLFLQITNINGTISSTSLYPLYNEQWQDTMQHYTVGITDMLLLSNDEVIICGDWLHSINGIGRAVPFFLKINSTNEISGHFKFGSEEIDNYNAWLLPTEGNLVLFAYGHGTQWLDVDYPEIDMRIGLFDPLAMDTLWTRSYGHAGGEWQIQDFEQTSDGGYALLGRGSDNGELMAFILKVDSEFNEEWFKIYDPPLATFDATLYDLEVTAEGGMAAVGNIIATDEAFYRTWLLKLDACGDLVWSGCPFVGIEENKPVSFSISPNPTNHSILLQSSEIIHDISMTDLSGRQVFAQLIMSETKEIDLSELSSGVYLLQATYMDGKTEVVRVVRE